MNFNCTLCGLCCATVGHAIKGCEGKTDALSLEVLAFPYATDENGRCENLGEDNTCKVYDHRPDICNIAKTYDKHFKSIMSEKEYHDHNYKACDYLQQVRPSPNPEPDPEPMLP